jgi:hypothetical protein
LDAERAEFWRHSLARTVNAIQESLGNGRSSLPELLNASQNQDLSEKTSNLWTSFAVKLKKRTSGSLGSTERVAGFAEILAFATLGPAPERSRYRAGARLAPEDFMITLWTPQPNKGCSVLVKPHHYFDLRCWITGWPPARNTDPHRESN